MNNTDSKLLATAKPNPEYEHYRNLRNVVLEVRMTGTKVMYFEVQDGTKRRLISRDLALELFAQDKHLIADRPFIQKGNKEFWAILKKRSNVYQELKLSYHEQNHHLPMAHE